MQDQMNGYIHVILSGLYSSIQDRGRIGYRKYGVPLSGAMDEYNAELANRLLNNDIHAAVMEITLTGPRLQFSTSAVIAITGAHISPKINDINCPLNKSVGINAGDILSFGALHYGARSYLAVKNGFQTECVMKSYSYFREITQQAVIQKGDKLPIHAQPPASNMGASVKTDDSLFSSVQLPCYRGPEFEFLNEVEKESIFQSKFSVSRDNNRMGYRLEGPPLQYPSDYNMLTSAVLPGTVQLTPSGQLIILMKDCQTTGGYPRVLQLTSRGINILAQKKAMDDVSFGHST